jgi:hypothetical protein
MAWFLALFLFTTWMDRSALVVRAQKVSNLGVTTKPIRKNVRTLHPTSKPNNYNKFKTTPRPTSPPSSLQMRTPTQGIIPSKNPTLSPTRSSTPKSSQSPTKSSNLLPSFNTSSQDPTTVPTFKPTLKPLWNPTTDPTTIPTLKPSQNPTAVPTNIPTLYPTPNPTIFPTIKPSFSPTFSPTLNPTKSPTLVPILLPSNYPSEFPTVTPTLQPTLNATISPPTSNPIKSPTSNPTTSPFVNERPTTNPTSFKFPNPTDESQPISSPPNLNDTIHVMSCPSPMKSSNFTNYGWISLSIPDDDQILCTLHQISSDDRSLKPVARSYSGYEWEASSGAFSHLLWICDKSKCTVNLPILPPGAKYLLTSLTAPNTYRKDGLDEVARFLEQATFGPTRADFASFDVKNLPQAFASWIKEQQEHVSITSHRAYFRERTNSRMESATRNGAVTHPCKKGSIYRRFAFSMKDDNKYLNITSVGSKVILSIDGFVRTVVEGPISYYPSTIWPDGR